MLRKPRKRWRGLERQLLVKLRNALVSMENRDDRAQLRAGELGVDPYLFSAGDTSTVGKAITSLKNRVKQALGETE